MTDDESRVMGILSYISVFVLIPLLTGPKNEFVRTHSRQGLILCIIQVACKILILITGWIPLIGMIIGMIARLILAVTAVLSVLGIIYVLRGEDKELPVIGKIKF